MQTCRHAGCLVRGRGRWDNERRRGRGELAEGGTDAGRARRAEVLQLNDQHVRLAGRARGEGDSDEALQGTSHGTTVRRATAMRDRQRRGIGWRQLAHRPCG